MTYEVTINGKNYRLDLARKPDHDRNLDSDRKPDRWSCRLDGRDLPVDAVLVQPDVLSLRIGNRAYEVKCERGRGELHVWVGDLRYAAEIRDPRSLGSRGRALAAEGPRKLTAPMPGKIVRLLAREGAEVDAGAGVLVVEAMKMQNELKSPKKGRVQKILVREGAAVNAGDVLAIVE